MMRMLLPLVLLLVGVGGGVGAGLMLGGGADEAAEGEDHAADDGHGSEDEHADDEHGDDGHGDDEHADDGHGDDGHGEEESANPPRVEPAGEGTEYVRINNQFVVPIVRNGTVRSLVVMSMSVEVDVGQNGVVFNQEPRLRDSFLRVMFAHANAGGFDGQFTEAAAMAPLRDALREAAQGILGRATTHDVLITDITRQDA